MPAREPANAAFFYAPGNFDAAQPKLMGRHAATEGFLRGWVRHAGVSTFHAVTGAAEHFEDFRRRVAAFGGAADACREIPLLALERAREPGCVFRPGPNVAALAYRRRAGAQRDFSLCGVTHTTAEHQVVDAIGALLTAPVQAWDALVCTSRAVKAMVDHVLARQAEYLEARVGARPPLPIELPVIPLGLACDDFAPDPAARAGLRARIGAADDDVVFLFMGRLSHVEKANPLPMLLALEAAAARTQRRVHLVQAGWFASAELDALFREAARVLAPTVRASFLDGREPAVRAGIWHAADVFTSLSDNVQETFGITPVEAMAAGLPVVVSDWDGYRDTVEHGAHGFRVPTWAPAPPAGEAIAARYELGLDGYLRYCASSMQSVAVDVAACADAYAALIESPSLRASMGEAARRSARARFDHPVVVAAHQALFAELDARRARAEELAPRADGPASPLRDDPFAMFAAWPTHALDATTVVALASPGQLARARDVRASHLASLLPELLAPEAALRRLFDRLRQGAVRVDELREEDGWPARDVLLRTLGALAKSGLVRLGG